MNRRTIGRDRVAPRRVAAELLGYTDPKVAIQHYFRRNAMVNTAKAEMLERALAKIFPISLPACDAGCCGMPWDKIGVQWVGSDRIGRRDWTGGTGTLWTEMPWSPMEVELVGPLR